MATAHRFETRPTSSGEPTGPMDAAAHEQPDADARPEGVPGHAAEHPRPSAAGRGGHRDHPRPRAGCARVPRQCPADPRRDPHVRGDRGGADVPPAPRVRVAGQRDADRERRGADPPRSQHAAGRSLDDPRAGTCSPAVAGVSLLTKYVIRYRGSHLFNPSNIGLVAAFLVLGSTRVEPLDFWWSPLDAPMIAGVRRHPDRWRADHAPPRSPGSGGDLLGRARRRRRAGGPVRALHGRPVGIRAGVRVRLLASDRHLARGVDLPVLHAHRPEDGAARPRRPDRCSRSSWRSWPRS